MTALHVSPAPPTTLVLFGATGDLTRRLLIPALINMIRMKLIDDQFRILGIGIDEGDDESLRSSLENFHQEAGGEGDVERGKAWKQLRSCINYLRGDFTQDAVYEEVARRIGEGNAAYYLAVQPRFFGDIVDKLADHHLMDETPDRFRRVAIEKPFGRDLASAKSLNARILSRVAESQVYRVDHFLGKETVQNIMTARFANMMIERLWTSDAIDHVEITAAETVGVGTRGKFYDATGALRDMVPNHLFQLLAMVAMEPPNSFDAESVRDEKGKVLKAVHCYTEEEAGQYGVRGAFEAGVMDGKPVPAFTDIPDVSDDSTTETFVALKLKIDTWRWAGVPFYLRTGKVMGVRDTEVVIVFKHVPFSPFSPADGDHLPANRLVIQIQPNEGLRMDMLIKRPGLDVQAVPIALDFLYADRFDISHQVGYESLLYDLFTGDQTLFQRADAIEAGWAAVQPFLDLWAKGGKPDEYAPGSFGPDAASALLTRDGRKWHELAAEKKS